MACDVEELLVRINRLSEIALEFHGEDLGEHAAYEIVSSAMDLGDILNEDGTIEEVEGTTEDEEEIGG